MTIFGQDRTLKGGTDHALERSVTCGPKTHFVSDYVLDTLSFTELCARYQISRKTGYKWMERYIAVEPAGL